MTCREFLNHWNDRLDGRSGVDIAALDRHSAECVECGRLAVGFLTIESYGASIAVPDGMADRILAAWALERPRSRNVVLRSVISWGAIGTLAAAAALFLAFAPWRGPEPMRRPSTIPASPRLRPWTSTVAEATTATIDLARDTSAPAARLGQDVLVAAGKDELGWAVPLPAPSASTEWLPAVTKSVKSGVGPISGSARRAFSFLSAPGAPGRPVSSVGDSGA